MEINDVEALEIELRKNTEILENTFERFNLKVISIAYSGSKYGDHISLYVELATINGDKIIVPKNRESDYIKIKVNYYENGNLLCSDKEDIHKNGICGYDTIEIGTSYFNIVSRATSARLYVTI